MGLPKFEVPVTTIVLPISELEVQYRPFTVKEENIVNMIATEKDEDKFQKSAIEGIRLLVKACTFEKVTIDDLPIADLEYLFLKIKEASTGEVTKRTYICKTDKDGNPCNAENQLEFFVDDAEIVMDDDLEQLIKLNDEISIEMGYITFEHFAKGLQKEDTTNVILNTIANSIVKVFYKEEVITEFTAEELIENILSNLTADKVQIITQYIEGMPKLKLTKEFQCVKCGKKHTIEADNLISFFG